MKTRQERPVSSLLFNIVLIGSSQYSKKRRRNKSHTDWKEELSIQRCRMIVFRENPKKFTKNIIRTSNRIEQSC